MGIIDVYLHAVKLAVAALRIPLIHTGGLVLQVENLVCCDRVAAYRTRAIEEGGDEATTFAVLVIIDRELRVDSQRPVLLGGIGECSDSNVAQADIWGMV